MPSEPEVFEVGRHAIRVVIRPSCLRRDSYELRCPGPLPLALTHALAELGRLRTSGPLWVLDVPGTHQITIAAPTGRVVIMPRLRAPRPAQRTAALGFAAWLDERL